MNRGISFAIFRTPCEKYFHSGQCAAVSTMSPVCTNTARRFCAAFSAIQLYFLGMAGLSPIMQNHILRIARPDYRERCRFRFSFRPCGAGAFFCTVRFDFGLLCYSFGIHADRYLCFSILYETVRSTEQQQKRCRGNQSLKAQLRSPFQRGSFDFSKSFLSCTPERVK